MSRRPVRLPLRSFDSESHQNNAVREPPLSGIASPSHRTSLDSPNSRSQLSPWTPRSPVRENPRIEHSSAKGDPLGITIIHEPEGPPSTDLVLVHGFGGSAYRTWCWDNDPNSFWAKEWLPLEGGMESVRVWSYGYNANFSSRTRTDSSLNISEFAHDLLFSLKYAIDDETRGPSVGQLPIIFVAHSLGGLVVKKAYILGRHDENYEHIFQSTRGILFLATPNRGCHLPGTLGNVLLASLAGQTPRQYINELSAKFSGVHAINEQWQALSPKLSFISMFETLPTNIGNRKLQVLNGDTSTLGVTGETTKALNADHQNVCKYSSRLDPNYGSVRDMLKQMLGKSQPKKLHVSRSIISDSTEGGPENLEDFLGAMDALYNDLEFFSEKQTLQSCQWFVQEPTYQSFTYNTSLTGILWCTGPPGFGKSVLCSSVVQSLLDQGERVAFHFFRFGDQAKNSIAKTLASIAYQVAVAMPSYRRTCIRLSKQAGSIRNMTTRSLWQKLYADTLFKLQDSRPMYIVIDGLDECDDATVLLKFLQGLKSSFLTIKIIIFSRKTHELQQHFEKLAKTILVPFFDLSQSTEDLRNFIDEEMEDMHGDDEFKQRIKEQLVRKAQGNFLWTSLVITEIHECHTVEAVNEALSFVPTGLEDLYYRMHSSLEKRLRDNDQRLARDIFEWIVCARRALSLNELQEALLPDHKKLLDLAFTIGKVCGDFVIIDNKKVVSMIHLTAKDFLLENTDLRFHISEKETHHKLMLKCLEAVQNFESRRSQGPVKITAFVLYAATSWPFHLQNSIDEADQDSSAVLTQFFSAPCVLAWIFLLAGAGQLKVLVHASKVIGSFIRHSQRLDEDRNPMVHRLQEREILTIWSTDMLRLVGKFAPQLTSTPKLIFGLIPPFCPPDSAIRQQFANSNGRHSIEISGLSNTSWDDCVAKFAVPNGQTPLGLRCCSKYLAMILRDGTVILYYSDTLQEARIISHGERVSAWAFNRLGDRLVTSSMSHTTVWNSLTAEDIVTVAHEGRIKPLTISFADDDSSLVICTDDRKIRKVFINISEDLESEDDTCEWGEVSQTLSLSRTLEDVQTWQVLDDALGPDTVDGKQLATPRCVEFDSTGSLVAVFYREFQLSVWSLDGYLPNLVGTCRRSYDTEELHTGANFVIQALCWNNVTGHILGMDREMKCVFKWHPYSNEYVESNQVPVGTIACSTDGKIFVTGSQDGSIRIWDFQHLSVIYQLSCSTLVTDLAIDPEGFRIYDIRENFCSVWNPNALIRMWEIDDRADDDASSARESSIPSSSISETTVISAQSITALALNEKTFDFAIGDDQGNVIHFSSAGEKLNNIGKGFMSVRPLCWSPDGTCLAYSDLARQVKIEQLEPLESAKPAVTILRTKENERTGLLLFSNDCRKLLVASDKDVKIWSIETKSRISQLPQERPTMWINDPTRVDGILGFDTFNAYVTSWSDFSQMYSIPLKGVSGDTLLDMVSGVTISPISDAGQQMSSVISKALVTTDGVAILLQVTEYNAQQRRNNWAIASLSDLYHQEIVLRKLPASLQERLLMPIGFVSPEATEPGLRRSSVLASNERRRSSAYSAYTSKLVRSPSPHKVQAENILVFLDIEHWVCSCNISDIGEKVKIRRHFFLPRDWLNAGVLDMATLRLDGALLCPKNGEVAIVTNGLREEWID